MKLPVWMTILGVLLTVQFAFAVQPGTGLLDPWKDRQIADTYDNPLVVFDGRIRGRDIKTSLFLWESYGRVRFLPDSPRSPAIGYRLLTADFGFGVPDLPNGMNDIALAVGAPLLEWDGWTFSLIGGAGYAGDTPFGDPNAWYGIAHAIFDRQLSETDRLAFTLDYRGNNALLPDVPLPGIRYTRTGDTLTWTIGYPFNQVTWKPDPRWTLSASYEVPHTADARVAYDVGAGWSLYAQFSNFFHPFTFAGDPSDRGIDRWFFQMRRVEAGVRFIHGKWIDAAIGVGYAFDQTLDRGFDIRNLNQRAAFADRPYIGLTLLGSF